MCGAWGKFWTVSIFFLVRNKALECKPYDVLIIVSVGLGLARENFGT